MPIRLQSNFSKIFCAFPSSKFSFRMSKQRKHIKIEAAAEDLPTEVVVAPENWKIILDTRVVKLRDCWFGIFGMKNVGKMRFWVHILKNLRRNFLTANLCKAHVVSCSHHQWTIYLKALFRKRRQLQLTPTQHILSNSPNKSQKWWITGKSTLYVFY